MTSSGTPSKLTSPAGAIETEYDPDVPEDWVDSAVPAAPDVSVPEFDPEPLVASVPAPASPLVEFPPSPPEPLLQPASSPPPSTTAPDRSHCRRDTVPSVEGSFTMSLGLPKTVNRFRSSIRWGVGANAHLL